MALNITRSNFITQEYTRDQTIYLTNVISLEAYNNSPCDVYINKLKIRPYQKSVIVRADFTISDLTLNLSFAEIANNTTNFKFIEGIPSQISPKIRQTVVLYSKELRP